MDTVLTLISILIWVLWEVRYSLVAITICIGSLICDLPPWWATLAVFGCWFASTMAQIRDD